MNEVLAIIMAGGLGERLQLLTRRRSKAAVPFGGKFRLIDFTLSNASTRHGNSVVFVIANSREHISKIRQCNWVLLNVWCLAGRNLI